MSPIKGGIQGNTVNLRCFSKAMVLYKRPYISDEVILLMYIIQYRSGHGCECLVADFTKVTLSTTLCLFPITNEFFTAATAAGFRAGI